LECTVEELVEPSWRAPSRLRAIRQRRRLDQEQLATAAGVSIKTLQRYELKQVKAPSFGVLHRLAAALECPLEDLIEPEWIQAGR
jgi:transcriptional regulator with XRE-family HTH domain